ncbi:MAG: hypothetical protein ACU0DK_12760 [Pseudooceanicola sp.]
MRHLAVILCALVLAGSQVAALTPTRKLSGHGSWAVYTMPLVMATGGQAGVVIVDHPFCAAQVGTTDTVLLRLVYGFDGMVIVQAASPSWNFRRRVSRATLRATPSLVLRNAVYAEAFIESEAAGQQAMQTEAALVAMAQTPGQKIELADDRGRAIARFPVNGMAAALGSARSCASRYR